MSTLRSPALLLPRRAGTLVRRLDTRDRALFRRCVLTESSHPVVRLLWVILTHLGGAVGSIAAGGFLLATGGPAAAFGMQSLVTLALSHLAVQTVKRTVNRPRPARGTASAPLAAEPDPFSFPSGHAAAAMSIAMGYAAAFPDLGIIVVSLAGIVGMSRVMLGVHYPGDVLAGQCLAVSTWALLR